MNKILSLKCTICGQNNERASMTACPHIYTYILYYNIFILIKLHVYGTLQMHEHKSVCMQMPDLTVLYVWDKSACGVHY